MRWIFISCLTVLFLSSTAEAVSDDCAVSDVQVTVTSAVANPVYDFSIGIPEIQSIADIVVHQVRAGWALGFTQTEPLLVMDAPIAVAAKGDGHFCAKPRYVHLTVGYKAQTVYVPHEIPGDTCGLNEVIEHEQKHLAANREMAVKYAALLQSRFSDYFKYSKPLPQGSVDGSTELARNILRGVLGGVVAEMVAENAVQQQDIDSADEYHRLLTVCGGQLAEVVRDARQPPRLAGNVIAY